VDAPGGRRASATYAMSDEERVKVPPLPYYMAARLGFTAGMHRFEHGFRFRWCVGMISFKSVSCGGR
jgi:hypothetical protein